MKTFKADYVTQSEFMKREGTREEERMKNIFLESDYKHILSISDDYIIWEWLSRTSSSSSWNKQRQKKQ